MNESTFRSLFQQAIGQVEVPAHLVTAVSSRGLLAPRSRPHAGRNWDSLKVAAAALLAIAIVAGLMVTRSMNRATVAKPAQQLCVPGATQPSDRFARVHGCIAYYDGTRIVAVDPYHPANRILLGPSNGRLPVAWSRDGRRLLLTSTEGDLYVMNTDGSQTQLTSLGKTTEGSFSPDGTKVVYSRQDDGLYVVDANGGSPRLISKSYAITLGLESPAWSPDGSRIAYMAYLESRGRTYQLWTVNPDGTDPRQLVAQGGSGGLSWSPDGSMLAFDSGLGSGIYIVHADGSGLRRVNDNGTRPSWSPNGSRIAFIRGAEMFTMAPDGSDVTLVNGVVVAPPSGLAWNPVSQPLDLFALAHGYIVYSYGSQIWAVDPNPPFNQISLGPSIDLAAISWSRDGSRLLLRDLRDSLEGGTRRDLYVMKADGSETRLTSDGLTWGEGSFSPDGAQVVFSRQDGGLFVVSAKGGTPRLLANGHPLGSPLSPAWSPDGSRIAYLVYLEFGGPAFEIWTMNPDGTDPRKLVDLGKGRAGGLAWSPDGSRLTFHFSPVGPPGTATASQIDIVRADGSGLHRINDGGNQPSWSPDGTRIAFTLGGEMFTMDPDGSSVTRVEGVLVGNPVTWNPVK